MAAGCCSRSPTRSAYERARRLSADSVTVNGSVGPSFVGSTVSAAVGAEAEPRASGAPTRFARGRATLPPAMVEDAADGELVRRIARAESAPEAEAELCRRFAPRIRLYGLRHLKTEDHAADLAQSVLLVVLEAARAGRIRELEHVERFVLGACRNLALRIRQREARSVPTAPEALDLGVYLPEFERVDQASLGHCLTKLDARSRAVVLLSFQAERSTDEIAEQLELSPGNVRVLRYRALSQLRHCLTHSEGARP